MANKTDTIEISKNDVILLVYRFNSAGGFDADAIDTIRVTAVTLSYVAGIDQDGYRHVIWRDDIDDNLEVYYKSELTEKELRGEEEPTGVNGFDYPWY